MSAPTVEPVKAYLLDLQDRICAAFEAEDGSARFVEQRIEGPGGTLSRPRVLSDGPVIEKSGVMFTHSKGPRLPPAATERRPELAGRGFEAVSVSLIVHPRNPYVPTTHMNVRFFLASGSAEGDAAQRDPIWWIGGGFDLTPYYPFLEDVVAWHRAARAACEPFGADLYPRFKKACDAYFYLPHRGETRGVGGLFYDDFDEGGFESSFALMRSVGDHFLEAYRPILVARKDTPYGERERSFQLMRRGRYAEFNLVYDRGTKYGLQSGRRIESVLASMPPLATWVYQYEPEPGSPEAELYDTYLKPQDWLASRDG